MNKVCYRRGYHYKKAFKLTTHSEILRLHSLGNSRRSITLQVQNSSDTVARTIIGTKEAGYPNSLDDDVTNQDL